MLTAKYYEPTTRPTKMCLICEKPENPKALIADLSIPWLCDRCKNELRKMVGIEVSDDA